VAAQQPTSVSQLALIGLPLYASETDRSQRWSAKKIRPIEPERTGRYLLKEWERLTELSPGSHPALIHREFVDTVSAAAYDESYAMVRGHDLHDVVGRITCPTLIICPEGDPQARNQEYAAALIHDSELVRIDGGVFIVDERAGAVADLACRFFGSGATSAVGRPSPS
jgi:pimeloyl-ACP methyl ester carboxylesterase